MEAVTNFSWLNNIDTAYNHKINNIAVYFESFITTVETYSKTPDIISSVYNEYTDGKTIIDYVIIKKTGFSFEKYNELLRLSNNIQGINEQLKQYNSNVIKHFKTQENENIYNNGIEIESNLDYNKFISKDDNWKQFRKLYEYNTTGKPDDIDKVNAIKSENMSTIISSINLIIDNVNKEISDQYNTFKDDTKEKWNQEIENIAKEIKSPVS